jgi:DNA helicase HerA-like ATPase
VVTGATGSGVTVTTVAADVTAQPAALRPVTLYEPAVLTVMLAVVWPVLHW